MASYCELFGLEIINLYIIAFTQKKKPVKQSFLLIDISIIREIIDNNEVHKIKWVESRHQISDCLTKYGVSSSNLLTVLKGQKLLNHLH